MISIIQTSFLLGNHSFHTSAIQYSKENPHNTSTSVKTDTETQTETESSTFSNSSIEAQLRERRERLLQADQIGEGSQVQEGTNSNLDSFDNNTQNLPEDNSISDWDAYPWLRADIIGCLHNVNNPIRLFNWMRMLRTFLEVEYRIPSETITPGLLTRIFEMYNDNPDISIHDFLRNVRILLDEDPNFINNFLNNERENIPESTEIEEVPRPFGNFGEFTMNQVANGINNLTWPEYLERLNQLGVQPRDLIYNTIPYSLLMRGYITLVHNRPLPTNINPLELRRQINIRRLHLVGFSFVFAPLILYSFRYSPLSWSDAVQIEWIPNEPNSNSSDNSGNSNTKNSGLILAILSKVMNNKPYWLIILVIIIIVILLSLKIVGLLKFWLIYWIIGLTLTISFQLVNLILIYLVEKKKTNVPFILPKFIRNWLQKEFEEISQMSNVGINYLKKNFYLHLFMYLGVAFLFLLTFL